MNSSRKIKKEVKRIIKDFIKLNTECYKRNRHLHYLYVYFLSSKAIYKLPDTHLEEFTRQLKKMEAYSIDKSKVIQYREAHYCSEYRLTKTGKSVSLLPKTVYDYWYFKDSAIALEHNESSNRYDCFIEGMNYNEGISYGTIPRRITTKSRKGIKFLTSINGTVVAINKFLKQSPYVKTNITKFINKRKTKNKELIIPFGKNPKSLKRITR